MSVSRRFFMKASVATLSATFGVPSFALSPKVPEKWDESFDVIVVGTGFAGLAAAYEAKKAGASVLILDKMQTAGGNSIINGGIFAVLGSPEQKKLGIEDSPD